MIKCECKKCNSPMSEIPFEKGTITAITDKTEEEEFKICLDFMKNGINVFPNCQHCGEQMTLTFK